MPRFTTPFSLFLLSASFLAPAQLAHCWAGDPATARYAVVRIPSHGCSGTVIETGPGRSLILTCAHAFQGADARRPIQLNCPSDRPESGKPVGIRLVAVGVPDRDDLALLLLNDGPLPYCAPVAGQPRTRHCLSVGYDEMRLPAQYRPAEIVGGTGQVTYTRERPWHGRSGGALLDGETGELVGVVSGYTGPPNHREQFPGATGVYVSLPTIRAFLARGRAGGDAGGGPFVAPPPRPFAGSPFAGSAPPWPGSPCLPGRG